MIKIQKSGQGPNILEDEKDDTLKPIREKVKKGERPRNRDLPKELWRDQEVKDAIVEDQGEKCCYCEEKRNPKRELDVEHFRPKFGVEEEEEEHFGYWWLIFDWNNLLFSCKVCNQHYKKNKFPLINPQFRAWNEEDSIEDEEPYLLNPINDNPEDHISFDLKKIDKGFVFATAFDDKGLYTIDVVGLNDNELIEERAERASTFLNFIKEFEHYRRCQNHDMIEEFGQAIREWTSSNKRFSGMCREIAHSFSVSDEYVSQD